MSKLKILVGNAGVGKTTTLYKMAIEKAAELNNNVFFIVPEQYTMQAQKEIVERTFVHGTTNIDIVSFMRLAYRIFDELGTSISNVLEDHGKSMLLHKIIGNINNELVVYKNMKDKDGFIDQMKSILSEFYQYEIQKNEIENMLLSIPEDSLLYYKLKDIMLVSNAFALAMGNQYQVAEQLIELLDSVVEDSILLKKAVFYFDGFTGFTPVQYRLIKHLMAYGNECYFSLTMNHDTHIKKNIEPQIFSLSKVTYDTLIKCFNDVATSEDSYEIIEMFQDEPCRFRNNKELISLEHNIFQTRIHPYIEKTSSIILNEAIDIQTEAEYTAYS